MIESCISKTKDAVTRRPLEKNETQGNKLLSFNDIMSKIPLSDEVMMWRRSLNVKEHDCEEQLKFPHDETISQLKNSDFLLNYFVIQTAQGSACGKFAKIARQVPDFNFFLKSTS